MECEITGDITEIEILYFVLKDKKHDVLPNAFILSMSDLKCNKPYMLSFLIMSHHPPHDMNLEHKGALNPRLLTTFAFNLRESPLSA